MLIYVDVHVYVCVYMYAHISHKYVGTTIGYGRHGHRPLNWLRPHPIGIPELPRFVRICVARKQGKQALLLSIGRPAILQNTGAGGQNI